MNYKLAHVFCIVVGLVFLFISEARPYEVSFSISGTWTLSAPCSNSLSIYCPDAEDGGTYYGVITFDTSADDQVTDDPNRGLYSNSDYDMMLHIYGSSFDITYDADYTYSAVANDLPLATTPWDQWNFTAEAEYDPSKETTERVFQAAAIFNDLDGVELSSDELPSLIPNLSDWEEALLLFNVGLVTSSDSSPVVSFVGFGSVDEIKLVPEPGTIILLGSGLLGLAGYGRKRKK